MKMTILKNKKQKRDNSEHVNADKTILKRKKTEKGQFWTRANLKKDNSDNAKLKQDNSEKEHTVEGHSENKWKRKTWANEATEKGQIWTVQAERRTNSENKSWNYNSETGTSENGKLWKG